MRRVLSRGRYQVFNYAVVNCIYQIHTQPPQGVQQQLGLLVRDKDDAPCPPSARNRSIIAQIYKPLGRLANDHDKTSFPRGQVLSCKLYHARPYSCHLRRRGTPVGDQSQIHLMVSPHDINVQLQKFRYPRTRFSNLL